MIFLENLTRLGLTVTYEANLIKFKITKLQ